MQAFEKRTKSTEACVSEVLKLLQSLKSSAASRRERENAVLASLDATIVDKIELALEDHEGRIRSTSATAAAAAAAGAALLAPIVYIAVNKFLM